jgi:hypothetical protein
MLATWLHLGAPQKYKEIDFATFFEHWIIQDSYKSELDVLGVAGKLVKDVV